MFVAIHFGFIKYLTMLTYLLHFYLSEKSQRYEIGKAENLDFQYCLAN